MKPKPSSMLPVMVAAALVLASHPLRAQVPDPDPTRFKDAIAAFQHWDLQNTPPEHAILFVGSSSIRFWPSAESFPNRVVINRGFGGAHISDVNHYVHETVLRYAPDVIVFYCGDNDIAAGKTPTQVLEDYREFVDTVLGAKPSTRIIFISIKPSLARWKVWSTMQEANHRIRAYTKTRSNLSFVDIGPEMLGSDGRPNPTLLRDDGLHMTPAGYQIWNRDVDRALKAIGR